ncbi:ketopantoate reductase family protein [Sutcliffiella halmapala]|uniref:ketopantoate reductase family protein n=1 Tax=Sutcliffiella halmapala TaxID=79882 RepID=UPI000994B8DB|nr:ketopantoate reductase family protein [Sutcliffiella halmapala]
MKILIVGAGAVGGYFGGRLLEKGGNVTFLVREKRKKQLERTGLVLKSIHGDVSMRPSLIQAGEQIEHYDVVLVSMKAYQLDGAIEDFRPYVGPNTLILPLLNGISHLNDLDEAFHEQNILGGLCFVESTLDYEGAIVQTSGIHNLVFGERSGKQTERIMKLMETFSGTKSNFILSENINQDMWHKYLFIATLAGVTTLFRSPIGPIRVDKYGAITVKDTLREVASLMNSVSAPLAENIVELNQDKLQSMEPKMKSSMLRDMEKGLSVEAEHFFGYLLAIAEEKGIAVPTLEKIYGNLRIYEEQ